MSMNKNEEPSTAPNPDRWYTLTLGSSFKENQPSSKFCTLRYEFKPASVDKSQPGALLKTKDNKISVEFHNNQPGKPKVTFEGTSEDYKENDAVLFFDGNTFRLERLHRAVKRLRHVRLPGESALASSSAADAGSPPLGRGAKLQPQPQPQPPTQPQPQPQGFNSRNAFTAPPPPPPLRGPVSVEVERIDIGGGNSGGKSKLEKSTSTPPQQLNAVASPDSKDFDLEEHLDIMINDDEDDALGPGKNIAGEKPLLTGIDINRPQQNDTDDEIANVDGNDDNGVINAADALRAQVNAVEREEPTSSSSASSGSESSGSSSESGSGSSHSSSDSESSDGDSVNSI